MQRPCKHDHMLHWLAEGLLHSTTLVTPATTGAPLDPSAVWHPLSEIVPAEAAAAAAMESHVLKHTSRSPQWWFQDTDGAVQGPCEHDNMTRWLKDGALHPDTLVTSSGADGTVDATGWRPLSQVLSGDALLKPM